ncbi:hypothetical protein NMG60_11034268 [Bertholletia excelsa]
MASHLLIAFSFLFCLLVCTSSAPNSAAATSFSSKKVRLDLYYESLCPYCSNFIVNYLVKIFENGLISVVDLNLVPWGNAKFRGNDTFDCQHGSDECLLNTIEACAINVWPDLNKHFSFIYCVETLVYEKNYRQWETCFEKLGFDPAPVAECYSSGYGKQLELKYGAETYALKPPHEYVPWVVVDGQPLYEDYENFISYICKAYKGTTVPNACSNLSLKTILKGKEDTQHQVCYRVDETKSTASKIRYSASILL